MRKGDSSVEFVMAVLFILILGTGFYFGFCYGRYYQRLEAVKNGSAEWVADENGQAHFKWKSEVSLEQVQP